MLIKRLQIGFIHSAIAITLVPLNSTLNRVMIKELALSSLLVATLASLPYLFSPIQVAIGAFSDKHPVFGWRRTPYILIGWLLCLGGLVASPYVAYMLVDNRAMGILLGIFVFGAWGMGYNFATVSYFSLATEVSGEERRSGTIAVMFFMMIVGIIFTSRYLGNALEVYTPETLIHAFRMVAWVALGLGVFGLLGLEERTPTQDQADSENYSWREMIDAIYSNPQAKRFFWYLILLLTAILGQDILLEPFAAEAFALDVSATSRITSIWGTMFLVALALGALLERRVHKLVQAKIGAYTGIVAFALIVLSGVTGSQSLFYTGLSLLGIATGLSTVSNLSLMLDMTTVGSVGLFIGAWGMAGAVARLIGNMLSGAVRDAVTLAVHNPVWGYNVVFILELLMLVASLLILRQVDVSIFQQTAEQQLSVVERAAVADI